MNSTASRKPTLQERNRVVATLEAEGFVRDREHNSSSRGVALRRQRDGEVEYAIVKATGRVVRWSISVAGF